MEWMTLEPYVTTNHEDRVNDSVQMTHCKANNLFVWTEQWTGQLNVVFLFTVFCKFSSRTRGPLLVQILQCCLSDVFLVFDKTYSVF